VRAKTAGECWSVIPQGEMQTSGERTLALDYQSPQTARTIGSSRPVRLLALITSMALLAPIAHFLQRSRETLGGLSDWVLPISAASAGCVYCALVSLNVAGRTRPGAVSRLRRIGGIGAPVVLVSFAVGWVQDVLVDPYARRHDVVLWIAAAVTAVVIALIIAYLAYAHWNDMNDVPVQRRVFAG